MHKDWNWIDITCMIVVTGYFRGIFLSNSIKNEISDGWKDSTQIEREREREREILEMREGYFLWKENSDFLRFSFSEFTIYIDT